MEMPRRDRTRVIAAVLTVSAHAGLALWWLQLSDLPRPEAEQALQVVWIDRPSLPSSPAPPAPDVPGPTAPAAKPPAARATPPSPSTALQAVELPTADPAPVPDAAALHEQARQFARGQLPADAFERDPLRHRPTPRADGRFAMRDPISPEDVVVAIGSLFGGGPSDPCPRIRRNLVNADMADGRALAEEELRRLRRNCL